MNRSSTAASSSLAIVLVLGTGVGVAVATFALVDPVLLRHLPYANPDELVAIEVGTQGLTDRTAIPTFDDWRSRADWFKGLAAHQAGEDLRVKSPGGTVQLLSRRISTNFFEVLGVPGPRLVPSRDGSSALETGVVLTAKGAQQLGGADQSGVRSLATSDNRQFTVVSTLPNAFLFPDSRLTLHVAALLPYEPEAVVSAHWSVAGRSIPPLRVGPTLIGRLADGLTPEQLRAALSYRLPDGGTLDVKVERLSRYMTRRLESVALGAVGACLLILAMCTGSVANLLISRTAARRQEIATRTMLGARPSDIARLLVLDAGGLAFRSLPVAWLSSVVILKVALPVMPQQYLALGSPVVGLRSLVFSAVVASAVLVVCLAVSVLVEGLGSNRSPGGRACGCRFRARSVPLASMATQAALATVFAIGASTLAQSYARLFGQPTGFEPRALTAVVSYPPTVNRARGYDNVIDTVRALEALPGVAASAAVQGAMVTETTNLRRITVDGTDVAVSAAEVTLGFFAAAGMSVRQGRPLRSGDREWRGVVVNEAFCRRFWPSVSPLDQTIDVGGRQAHVVGIVHDAFDRRLDAQPTPTVYALLTPQAPLTRIVYVLGVGPGVPPVPAPLVHRAIATATPDAVIESLATLGDRLSETVRDTTFAMVVVASASVASALVMGGGLVGIVISTIRRRRREIAIRVALGARAGHVMGLVAWQTVIAATSGAAAGMIGGRWVSRTLESLTFGVEAGSWSTAFMATTAITLMMVVIALIASSRALRVEPARQLGVE